MSCIFDNVLYVIGNGFDLHHGVMSSYKAFRYWLEKHHKKLFCRLEKACRVNFLWSEFERALGYVSREEFLLSGMAWLPHNWDPNRDSYSELFFAEDMARNSGDFFLRDIQECFREWVLSIKWYPEYNQKKIMIDTEARFITFNYTPFLETQYGIPKENILYIHGKRADKLNPPLIGHDGSDTFVDWFKTKECKKWKRYYKGKYSLLPEVEMLTESVESFYSESEKPVSSIICKFKEFFDDLYDVEHIYVLGHSLGNVDMPYFKKISKSNDFPAKINWHISYYAGKERDRLTQLIQDNIMEQGNSLELFKMDDILLPSRISYL